MELTISLVGSKTDIKSIIEMMGGLYFKYNAVIPMPQSLRAVRPSRNLVMDIAQTAKTEGKAPSMRLLSYLKGNGIAWHKVHAGKIPFRYRARQAQKGLANVERYGYADCVEWAKKNWNSFYDVPDFNAEPLDEQFGKKSGSVVYRFRPDHGDVPYKVLEKLTGKFPSVSVEARFSEKDYLGKPMERSILFFGGEIAGYR